MWVAAMSEYLSPVMFGISPEILAGMASIRVSPYAGLAARPPAASSTALLT